MKLVKERTQRYIEAEEEKKYEKMLNVYSPLFCFCILHTYNTFTLQSFVSLYFCFGFFKMVIIFK